MIESMDTPLSLSQRARVCRPGSSTSKLPSELAHLHPPFESKYPVVPAIFPSNVAVRFLLRSLGSAAPLT